MDEYGNTCRGSPCMRKMVCPFLNIIISCLFIAQKMRAHGKEYFVGCSGWRPNSARKHESWSIPDNIDEAQLRSLLETGQLLRSKETRDCARILSPRSGGNTKLCSESALLRTILSIEILISFRLHPRQGQCTSRSNNSKDQM